MISSAKHQFLLLSMALLTALMATGQPREVLVSGRVFDAETGQPLSQVNIALDASLKGTTTNRGGGYQLRVKQRDSIGLSFRFVGYETHFKSIPWPREGKSKDTLIVNIGLRFQPVVLPPTSIIGNRPPDTVAGSNRFSIADYAFSGPYLLMLTYEKRLKKAARIVLIDKDENILSSHDIPGEATELFTDFMGHVNVITRYHVYRVIREGETIRLARISKLDFDSMIRPGVDTVEHRILFSNYYWNHPKFDYQAYNRLDSTVTPFRKIVDEELYREYRFEYYYLPPAAKVQARKLALENDRVEKFDVAAAMTGFAQSLYYTPLYAPLFVVNDTIMIFDHYSNHIYRYNEYIELVDSIDIHYHQDKVPEKWKRLLIIDEASEAIYALFQQKGYYYLKHLDTHTGEVSGSFKLHYKYVENIQIRDGYAYYIYRPYGSIQKKYLYREPILN